MKGKINAERNEITLENGKVLKLQDGQAVGDFIAEAKAFVKALDGSKLEFEKEQSEVKALAEKLQAASAKEYLADLAPDAENPQMSSKFLIEQKKLEMKVKAAEAKKQMQEQKIQAKKAELEAKQKEMETLSEKRKEEFKEKAEQMLVEAQAKHAQMLVEAEEKAAKWLEAEKAKIDKMVENGGQIKTTTGKGIRVEPKKEDLDKVEAILGKTVYFEKYGMPITGKVKARTVDYRVGIVLARIEDENGLIYHKSANKLDELTVVEPSGE